MLDMTLISPPNPPMNHGLGDAVVDQSRKLEQFFFERHPEISTKHKESGKRVHLTLGDAAFKKEVHKRLHGKGLKLFDWFTSARNAVSHYGSSDKDIQKKDQIRRETTVQDVNGAGNALLLLLSLPIETYKPEDISEACKYALTPRVFGEVFGAPDTPSLSNKNQTPPVSTPAKSTSEKERDIFAEIGTGEPLQKSSSRGQRQNIETEAAAASSKVDKAKANALDLFTEEQKPKIRKEADETKNVLGSISRILEIKDEDPNLVTEQNIAQIPAAAAESGEDDSEESDDPTLIIIKPPILVPDLAARLGLKPFNVMADLIKFGVFPAPNQPLEPEIAAQVCEIHGFTFERKRDKDKGFHKVEEVIVEGE